MREHRIQTDLLAQLSLDSLLQDLPKQPHALRQVRGQGTEALEYSGCNRARRSSRVTDCLHRVPTFGTRRLRQDRDPRSELISVKKNLSALMKPWLRLPLEESRRAISSMLRSLFEFE